MRRALREWWPALSHYFGLHPWDIYRLTPREITAYIAQVPKEK